MVLAHKYILSLKLIRTYATLNRRYVNCGFSFLLIHRIKSAEIVADPIAVSPDNGKIAEQIVHINSLFLFASIKNRNELSFASEVQNSI